MKSKIAGSAFTDRNTKRKTPAPKDTSELLRLEAKQLDSCHDGSFPYVGSIISKSLSKNWA
jgi:hypothetical protein